MTKKHLIAIIVTFVAVWATDFIIHAVWLGSTYKATASLWRPEAEMMTKMPWMFAGQFLIAVALATIYVKAMAERATLQCAAGFGFCIGLFSAGAQLIMYAVAPYPGDLVLKWFCAYLVQGLVLGLVLFFVCKPKQTTA
jgi:hypothetical protein